MPENESTRRLHYLLWLMLAWATVIFGRLIFLQVFHHDDLLRLAQQQQQKTKEIPATRGAILDRNGQTLAKSIPAESVCVNPQKIRDLDSAADLLAGSLSLDRDKLFAKLQTAWLRGSGFMWVKRKVEADEAERLRSLKLEYVEFRPEMRRLYPHHSLASHVIGTIGIANPEDTIEHGTAGVEASFEEDLAGEPGLARVYNDVKQNPYDSVIARKPEPGANITLTIDANLQYEAEKELEKAVHASGAKTGSVVAMNPYTGEMLAMANYPTFDPNESPTGDKPESGRSNLAITTPFEPGSVFKTVTLSAALETTKLTPDTMINCGNGSINLFGRIIHDHKSYSALSMADVLAHSSNIGAIQIGLKVGDATMYEYVRKFGFGSKTGIELPGESAGMVRRVKDWTPSSIGSVAMGHEISATSIQLAVAGIGDRERRNDGEAADRAGAAEAGRSGRAVRGDETGADHRAGDGDPDAADDGRRGAARHRQGLRESERLYLGRQDGIGADLRFEAPRVHAYVQREFSGIRAGDRIRRSWSR